MIVPIHPKITSGKVFGKMEVANAINLKFCKNFDGVVALIGPKRYEDGLRLNCTIENVRQYIFTTPDSAAGPDSITDRLMKSIMSALSYPMYIMF